MNVQFNTNLLNTNAQKYNKNQNNLKQTTFTANPIQNGADVATEMMKDSNLFAPLLKAYDKFTDGIAKHVTSKFINSKPIIGLASKFRNSDNLFQHCLTVGSVITSGLYMEKTLTNDKLDKDRKKTLAVNQGLTFLVSTIGAYSLDKYVKGWWSKLTEKFAGHLLNDNKFVENFHDYNNKIKISNEQLLEAAKGKSEKPLLKKTMKLEDYVKIHPTYTALNEADGKALISKIKGMGVLRTMIVFGFVYRYFVPVVVTKPANILCEKYLAHKRAKTENKQNA